MDTTGQATDTLRTTNGQPPNAVQTGNGQADAWVRVADLYPELRVEPRSVRRWIARHVPSDAQDRRPGPEGGNPELYLRAEFVPSLLADYAAGQPTDEHGTDTGHAPDVHETSNGQASDTDGTGTGPKEPVESAAPNAQQPAPDGLAELRAAYDTALSAERARVGDLQRECDRLRSQLETERAARETTARSAEEAERGRYHAEARLEGLRAAWWRWLTELDRLGRWRRWCRKWPEPPAELRSERLLEGGE